MFKVPPYVKSFHDLVIERQRILRYLNDYNVDISDYIKLLVLLDTCVTKIENW